MTMVATTKAILVEKFIPSVESTGIWQIRDQDTLLLFLGGLTEFTLESVANTESSEVQLRYTFTGQPSEKSWLDDKGIKTGSQLLDYYSTQKASYIQHEGDEPSFVRELVEVVWPVALDETQINNIKEAQDWAVRRIRNRLEEDYEQWNQVCLLYSVRWFTH